MPVAYSRVFWDDEEDGAHLQARLLRRSGLRRPRDRQRAARLERGSAPRDRGRSRRLRRSWSQAFVADAERGRDRAHSRSRLRARDVHGPDGQAVRRRSARPSAARGAGDQAGARGGHPNDLGSRRRGVPRPLGIRRAVGRGLRALRRVPVPRPHAVEDRVGRRGSRGSGQVVHRHGPERDVRTAARLDGGDLHRRGAGGAGVSRRH